MPLPVHFLKRHAFIAGRMAHLLTIGAVSGPRRRELKRVAAELGWGRYPTALPTVALAELLAAGTAHLPIDVREMEAADWNVKLYELIVLVKLVAARRPSCLFEIGTFDGRTTLNLAANAPPAAVVYTLDRPPERARRAARVEVGHRFKGTELEGKVRQLHGDTRTFDYGPYAGRCDFVFVDASHAYEDVCIDSENALMLVGSRRGMIVWHDYTSFRGVARALEERLVRGGAFRGLRHIAGTSMACLEP